MNFTNRRGTVSFPDDARTDAAPQVCPTCRSSAIVTTAKHPDANSYWRCTACGDVWNALRCQPRHAVPQPWR